MPARTVKLTAPERSVAVQSYVVETGKGLGVTLRHFFTNWLSRVPWLTLAVLAIVGGLAGALAVFVASKAYGRMENVRGFYLVFSGLPMGLGGLALVAQVFRNLRREPPKTYLRIVPYPDVPADYYPPRYRGEHRLMTRENDKVRCVACMMCATVCPADCIHIVAGDAAAAAGDPRAPDRACEKYPVRFEIDELRCVVCGFCVEACPCDAIRMDSGRHVPAFSKRGEFHYDRERLLTHGSRSEAVQGGEGPGWRERAKPPVK